MRRKVDNVSGPGKYIPIDMFTTWIQQELLDQLCNTVALICIQLHWSFHENEDN